MSRSSFTRKFSFTSHRKNSREGKPHPGKDSMSGPSGGGGGGAVSGPMGGGSGNHSYNSHHHYPNASTTSHHGPPGSHHGHHHHNSLQDKRQHSRRENSDVEKVARGIFGDVPLTDSERRLLSAAETGHEAALEQCVEENGQLNVNCRDYLGRTSLQLAVLGEHYDCVSYLLEKSSMDTIEEALLHAIKAENVRICDMVLSHHMYSDKSARMQLEFQHGFYDQEDNSSSFAPDITPIVLAAHCNNFDIVHMLIQKGFTIQKPHHYFCFCTECSNHKTFDRFVHSRSRLNAYRGLASTAYLSLSCDDPIMTAFELSKCLYTLAETEKEYKNEYRALSEACKGYAVDLLDLCRSNEEVMAALHGGSDTRDLSRIKMAIRYEQKKFIAHASCQEHLMSMWYAGVPWFQHQPFTMKLFLLPLGIMFIPVTAIIYVFLPYSRVGEVLRSPFMKFVNYICSYTAFLTLLFFATTLSEPDATSHNVDLFLGAEGVVNSLIIFYVLEWLWAGMFWAECKQLWEEGVKGYFSQMWNYMDITMLALYTAAYAIEGVIYTKVTLHRPPASLMAHFNVSMGGEGADLPDPQILSRVLFSVANVMSFARIAYILPASETFGQLQISYGRMLQDVGKFIFIYFTVMIAFICGLTSLYSLSNNLNNNFSNLIQTTGTLFWAAFGMGNSAAPQIATDGEAGRHRMVELVGYILYGVYILGAVVVLINMLIAMMSNTFEEIQTCEDIEWKFARAKLWISFIEEGTTLPIPFNIVPTPKSILKFVSYAKTFVTGCTTAPVDTDDHDGGFSIDYKAIMHKVVLRYVHKMKFDEKKDSLKDDMLDSKEEVLAQTYSMISGLHARLDSIERHLVSMGANPAVFGSTTNIHKPDHEAGVTTNAARPVQSPTAANFPYPSGAGSGTASGGYAGVTEAVTSPSWVVTTCSGCGSGQQQQVSPAVTTQSPSQACPGGSVPAGSQQHRAVSLSQSVPAHVPGEDLYDGGGSLYGSRQRLSVGSYYGAEPRKEFVSRRWSYYHHDRSGKGRGRGKGQGQRPGEDGEAQQQHHRDPPQLSQQQLARQQYGDALQQQHHSPLSQPRHYLEQSKGDHSQAFQQQQLEAYSYVPQARERSKSDYSPRSQDRRDYIPLRPAEVAEAGAVHGVLVGAENTEDAEDGRLKRQGTLQRSRHQIPPLSTPLPPVSAHAAFQRQSPTFCSPSSSSNTSSTSTASVSSRQPTSPLTPTSPSQSSSSNTSTSCSLPQSPLQREAADVIILRPDLTPTHTGKTLRREFSRTERHSVLGGSVTAGGGGGGAAKVGRSPSLGPGDRAVAVSGRKSSAAARESPSPRASSSRQVSPRASRHPQQLGFGHQYHLQHQQQPPSTAHHRQQQQQQQQPLQMLQMQEMGGERRDPRSRTQSLHGGKSPTPEVATASPVDLVKQGSKEI